MKAPAFRPADLRPNQNPISYASSGAPPIGYASTEETKFELPLGDVPLLEGYSKELVTVNPINFLDVVSQIERAERTWVGGLFDKRTKDFLVGRYPILVKQGLQPLTVSQALVIVSLRPVMQPGDAKPFQYLPYAAGSGQVQVSTNCLDKARDAIIRLSSHFGRSHLYVTLTDIRDGEMEIDDVSFTGAMLAAYMGFPPIFAVSAVVGLDLYSFSPVNDAKEKVAAMLAAGIPLAICAPGENDRAAYAKGLLFDNIELGPYHPINDIGELLVLLQAYSKAVSLKERKAKALEGVDPASYLSLATGLVSRLPPGELKTALQTTISGALGGNQSALGKLGNVIRSAEQYFEAQKPEHLDAKRATARLKAKDKAKKKPARAPEATVTVATDRGNLVFAQDEKDWVENTLNALPRDFDRSGSPQMRIIDSFEPTKRRAAVAILRKVAVYQDMLRQGEGNLSKAHRVIQQLESMAPGITAARPSRPRPPPEPPARSRPLPRPLPSRNPPRPARTAPRAPPRPQVPPPTRSKSRWKPKYAEEHKYGYEDEEEDSADFDPDAFGDAV